MIFPQSKVKSPLFKKGDIGGMTYLITTILSLPNSYIHFKERDGMAR